MLDLRAESAAPRSVVSSATSAAQAPFRADLRNQNLRKLLQAHSYCATQSRTNSLTRDSFNHPRDSVTESLPTESLIVSCEDSRSMRIIRLHHTHTQSDPLALNPSQWFNLHQSLSQPLRIRARTHSIWTSYRGRSAAKHRLLGVSLRPNASATSPLDLP